MTSSCLLGQIYLTLWLKDFHYRVFEQPPFQHFFLPYPYLHCFPVLKAESFLKAKTRCVLFIPYPWHPAQWCAHSRCSLNRFLAFQTYLLQIYFGCVIATSMPSPDTLSSPTLLVFSLPVIHTTLKSLPIWQRLFRMKPVLYWSIYVVLKS